MPERPTNVFRSLAGVPVLYDRHSQGDYGVRGRPHDFHVTQSFEDALDACFAELWRVCPLDRAEAILSAGTYADRAGSQHSRGMAMDIDAILWPQRRFVTLDYPTDKSFYIAVEAILRRHCDFVLTYVYNAAHHDHFHVDKAGQMGFGKSRSKTCFIQSLCRHVLGISVAVDGRWTPETEEALESAQRSLGVTSDVRQLDSWRNFLKAAAERAFADALSAPLPQSIGGITLELADTIEEVMADHPLRKHTLSRLQSLSEQVEASHAVDAAGFEGMAANANVLQLEEAVDADAIGPPSKAGRQLVRTMLWDEELLVRPAREVAAREVADRGWHQQFGGREWRYDERGVYIWEYEGGQEPLRTLGRPVTCRRIWELFRTEILRASQRFEVSPALIMMTIATETAAYRSVDFNGPRTLFWEPHVWNRDVQPPFQGDYSAGPMQTLATTARWVIRAQQLPYDPFAIAPPYRHRPQPSPTKHPLYDPDTNLTIGAAEIKQRWRTSGDDPILVAACFNAGGLYESHSNSWHLRTSNDHLDRAAKWFGDACAVLAEVDVRPGDVPAAISARTNPRGKPSQRKNNKRR
jgi:hypothetical protein